MSVRKTGSNGISNAKGFDLDVQALNVARVIGEGDIVGIDRWVTADCGGKWQESEGQHVSAGLEVHHHLRHLPNYLPYWYIVFQLNVGHDHDHPCLPRIRQLFLSVIKNVPKCIIWCLEKITVLRPGLPRPTPRGP